MAGSAFPTVEPVPLPEAAATPQSSEPLLPSPSTQVQKIRLHLSSYFSKSSTTKESGMEKLHTSPAQDGGSGRVIDLIDLPVVGLAVFKTEGTEGTTVISHGLGQGQGIRIGAEVDLVPDRLPAGSPIQDRVDGHSRGSRSRRRLVGLARARRRTGPH